MDLEALFEEPEEVSVSHTSAGGDTSESTSFKHPSYYERRSDTGFVGLLNQYVHDTCLFAE